MHPPLLYAVWLSQEWAWNVYPSTKSSSAVVVGSLGLQVLSTWWGTRNDFAGVRASNPAEKHQHEE